MCALKCKAITNYKICLCRNDGAGWIFIFQMLLKIKPKLWQNEYPSFKCLKRATCLLMDFELRRQRSVNDDVLNAGEMFKYESEVL